MKILDLKGYKSLRALNAFHTLMLGLKMLPAYMGEQYEDFYARIEEMPPADQEKMIREAVMFVELQKEEVEALAGFCADPNGVPYSAENLKSVGPDKIVEIVVAVCMKIAEIKIHLVTPAEKKKLKNFSVDLRRAFANNPQADLEEILNIAFYEGLQHV